jgi:hypothetical protein
MRVYLGPWRNPRGHCSRSRGRGRWTPGPRTPAPRAAPHCRGRSSTWARRLRPLSRREMDPSLASTPRQPAPACVRQVFEPSRAHLPQRRPAAVVFVSGFPTLSFLSHERYACYNVLKAHISGPLQSSLRRSERSLNYTTLWITEPRIFHRRLK